ncbi:FKBP-type peptidyl-prolyl cis-trans isomerase [Hymenobacter convexus]|uniref:FKBP-type peptidyl-prolyl cis-trans isomerase n=1 Tax=Hymenobacter sp. CA1UV-4 TaxID=3063782 RepID=UPI002712DBC3|nr:FKBP-type peptidyl-prolyl cis-trans isomerase [Hymenobacter sp. CA1UV-4]MDO7852080.1 FKBP-type peptidyl-prolyl cis-trans isomerase [Hymenobacter sp. CA1UV-4]
MKFPFSTGILRLLFPVLLGSAALVTTACQKDETTDYAPIDEGLIKKYITDNNITTAQRQASGLYYVPVTTAPTATRAVAGRTVSVLYTGTTLDGKVFDATKNQYTPFSFVLGAGKVIKGWEEGIALMRKGEKSVLLIPSGLAYGAQSPSSAIPPNSVLRFDVELVDIQ